MRKVDRQVSVYGSAARLFVHASLVGASLVLGCAGGADVGGGGAPATSGQKFCAQIAASAEKCVGATPCDQALVSDCANLVGILDPELIDAALACSKEGSSSPMDCLVGAVGGLAPTQADKDLASAFCSNCALGVPGCDSLFFSGDGGQVSLGLAVLPFSDDVVGEIKSACTSGPTCLATFLNCAEETLAKHALPTATAKCLVTQLVQGTGSVSGPTGTCGGSGGAPSTGSGNGPSTGAGPGSGTGVTSSASGGDLPCSTWNGNLAGCDASPSSCAYYVCSQSCWPFGTPLDVACPPPCSSHDGDVTACDADPQNCAYYDCSESCWPFGTPLEVACPPPPCSSHDGDVTACDADPQNCAYYYCSQSCWPFGTPIDVACP